MFWRVKIGPALFRVSESPGAGDQSWVPKRPLDTRPKGCGPLSAGCGEPERVLGKRGGFTYSVTGGCRGFYFIHCSQIHVVPAEKEENFPVSAIVKIQG